MGHSEGVSKLTRRAAVSVLNRNGGELVRLHDAESNAGVLLDLLLQQAPPVNRRTLEQLRRSRTKVTNATGAPTLPDNVAGMPIVITDSLSNAEA